MIAIETMGGISLAAAFSYLRNAAKLMQMLYVGGIN